MVLIRAEQPTFHGDSSKPALAYVIVLVPESQGGLLPRDPKKHKRWWRMGQVFGVSLVGGGHSPPGRTMRLKAVISQIPNTGSSNPYPRVCFMTQPVPHCLPGSWPIKKSCQVASSDAWTRRGLGCRALSRVLSLITDGQ